MEYNRGIMMLSVFALAMIMIAYHFGQRDGMIKQCRELGGEIVMPVDKCINIDGIESIQSTYTYSGIPTGRDFNASLL